MGILADALRAAEVLREIDAKRDTEVDFKCHHSEVKYLTHIGCETFPKPANIPVIDEDDLKDWA